jgi:transcriptional regulator with XRE-family HTH domain
MICIVRRQEMNKSMWYEIRKNAKLTLQNVADYFNVSKQYIHKLEYGETRMPPKYQIYYLSLRNSDEDKIVIEYLKELENKRKEVY